MYEQQLDGMTWSYSRLNTYQTCPHAFMLNYIEKKRPLRSNAFAEYGTFCHKLLQMYFDGKADFYELAEIYRNDYDINVMCEFPAFYSDLSEKYYNDGLKFFNEFEGISDNYRIIGTEQEFNTTFAGKPFTGFIDLILQDKTDGKYIIVDHKSKSRFGSKKEKTEYFRQLYLYSVYIKEYSGEFPDQLAFNMFRTGTTVKEKFAVDNFHETVSWTEFLLDMIYSDEEFPKNKNEFYCKNICDVRDFCDNE